MEVDSLSTRTEWQALRALYSSIDHVPTYSKDDAHRLVPIRHQRVYRAPMEPLTYEEADLVTGNVRLVIFVGKRLRMPAGVSVMDMLQAGMMGLMRAAKNWDPARGCAFSTYAIKCIRGYMQRERLAATLSRAITLPTWLCEEYRKYSLYQIREERETGCVPDAFEIARRFDVDVQRVTKIFRYVEEITGLHGLIEARKSEDFVGGESDGLDHWDEPLTSFADEAKSPEDVLVDRDLTDDLRNALDQLTPNQAFVIRHRYGLDDEEEKTLEEIRLLMGLSRERVRQIEAKALERLRCEERHQHLKQFL